MKLFRCSLLASLLLLILATSLVAQTPATQDISLVAPQKTGGMPLMQALANRHTTRGFANATLTPQQLSNLLWSAFGVNRTSDAAHKPGRTAPSGRDMQEVEIYVVLPGGVYCYEPMQHTLKFIAAGDARAKVGTAPAANAAATLVFVAKKGAEFSQVDTGFIGQNVYLYAASEGLNAWFYHVDEKAVAAVLKLGAEKEVLYAQSVGVAQK